MPFAVFDSLPFIRRRDWIAFTFQFRLWVVASDDCRSCYCPESPSQLPFADFDSLAPIWPPASSRSFFYPASSGCRFQMTAAVAIGRMVFGFHLCKCILPFSIRAIHSGNSF